MKNKKPIDKETLRLNQLLDRKKNNVIVTKQKEKKDRKIVDDSEKNVKDCIDIIDESDSEWDDNAEEINQDSAAND